VALIADDVLVDALVVDIDRHPGARAFLIGAAVYRRPVDRKALVVQSGDADETAASTPDYASADAAITAILTAAGIAPGVVDPAMLANDVQSRLAPHRAVLEQRPTPPFREPAELDGWIAACQTAALLDIQEGDYYSVHRWTATILADQHCTADEFDHAHRRAAAYWQWRNTVWPQDLHEYAADVVEERHHHLAAGDIDAANESTEKLTPILHQIGAWDDEIAIISNTLTWLPDDHPRRPGWYHQLGRLAEDRGDYIEAGARYHQALRAFEQLDDQANIAKSHHQLGNLAYQKGDSDEARLQYHRALDINERLNDQAGLASSTHQLGILAQDRGDYDEAEARFHRP